MLFLLYNELHMKNYNLIEFPKSRLATLDVGRIGNKKHQITGLLEVDVTCAKEMIRNQIRNGKEIGFISWLIKCVAETVSEDPSVQALNKGRRRQVVFKDVDISLPLEREVDGKKVPLAALIKNADKKSAEDIHSEIKSYKGQAVDGEKDFVLSGSGRVGSVLFFNSPQWIRMMIWKCILGNPFIRKKSMGTVIVTNVGMTGGVSGWIIPKTMHNLAIGIGSINKRPWVVNGEIMIRDIMHLTVFL